MSETKAPTPAGLVEAAKSWARGVVAAWDRFWFAPKLPHTLSLLRIAAGTMLLYSHLVLASDLMSFVGDDAWINNETARALHDGTFGESLASRTYLWNLHSPIAIWIHHVVTIVITACFAAGLLTRIAAPLALFLQLMYLHRLTGALFGLDQIVTYMTMYLAISPCGACFSVDARLRRRFASRLPTSRWLRWLLPGAVPSVAANVATRLMQIHLCVIYLFGGLAKARGQTWWDGMAVWYSVGNYEYQSMDMTWLSRFPPLMAAMTHVTLAWEIFYCALVWPKLTRPVVLAMAVMVHGGIALFLGMVTFGTMMIAANMIFLEPQWLVATFGRRPSDDTASDRYSAEDSEDELDADAPDIDDFENEDLDREDLVHSELGSDSGNNDSLQQREQRLREKSRRLREREQKYHGRVKRLKEREAKIKRLVDRRREGKRSEMPDSDDD